MDIRPVYEIDTPENVRFSFERAGLASRALAWAVDLFVMLCILQAAAVVLSLLSVVFGKAATAIWLVIAFLVQWWYAALCEWRFGGRTLGKRLVGLATMDDRGLSLTLLQAVIRNLLRIAVFELGWRPEIPLGVAISEAVDLAKRYSTDDSGRFVNGMLARIGEHLRPNVGNDGSA